jgi:hypothetical protein
MLVQNLKNPAYIDLVLGDIEKLPAKLSEVGKLAGPFSRWIKKQNVKNEGKLSLKILRKENFIEALVEISLQSF